VPERVETAEERRKRERKESQRIRQLFAARIEPEAAPRTNAEWSMGTALQAPEAQSNLRDIERRQSDATRDARRSELAARVAEEQRRARDRSAAYQRAPVTEGLAGDIMGMSNQFESLASGAVEGVSLGFADEAAGAVQAMGDDTYEQARDRARQLAAERASRAPGWNTAGRVVGGMLPALAIPAAGAESISGRVLQSGMYGAGLGAVQGLGSSEGDALTQLRDTAEGAGYGFAGGATGQAIGELGEAGRRFFAGEAQDALLPSGVPSNARRLVVDRAPDEAERIRQDPELRRMEDTRQQTAREAARHRLRALAPGSTSGDINKALDGYPGGAEQLVDDLREFGVIDSGDRFLGVIPEAADQAQQRARFLRQDAGRVIGEAEQRVAASGSPDALVDMGPVAQRLRHQASVNRTGNTPLSDRMAGDLEDLAARYEASGRVPILAPETTPSARSMMSAQDDIARYGEQAVDATRPYATEQARVARRAIRGEMDEAMQRVLPPEEFAPARLARRQDTAAIAIDDLGQAGMGRATGNRQLTITDTIAGAAGGPGTLDQLGAIIQNRFIRGREQAFMAQLGEARADRLAREISARLSAQGNQRAASALDIARRRGSPVMGVLIREYMESSPTGAQDVANAIAGGTGAQNPGLARERELQLADPNDPTAGLGGEDVPAADVPVEELELVDPDDPAGGF
jgi:hypothetical protein